MAAVVTVILWDVIITGFTKRQFTDNFGFANLIFYEKMIFS